MHVSSGKQETYDRLAGEAREKWLGDCAVGREEFIAEHMPGVALPGKMFFLTSEAVWPSHLP